jgi:2,3-dihydroxybiphenyl 1,2-dioxygenase
MNLNALGYVGIRTKNLDDWADYGTRFLGMQLVDKSRGTLALRMDDRKQRVIVHSDEDEGPSFYGWEVADATALDALAGHLEKHGVKVARGSRALADERRVKDLIVFADPIGNRLEVFHGAEVAADAFKPGRSISGFRTGPLGMGHVVLMVTSIDTALPFYRDLLGFKISDFIRKPITAYFLHANPRHHSVALFEGPHTGMHHLMVELYSFDDVGQGYDIALGEKERIVATLGRHPNDLVTSFYMHTPSDILVEYGWGGAEVDDATWQPQEMTTVGSYWGHHGLFEAIGGDAAPPPMPTMAGQRAPLQVLDGNYQRMSGVCPWWDSMKR